MKTVNPAPGSLLVSKIESLDDRTVWQVLAHVQQRIARDQVIQRLLEARLSRVAGSTLTTPETFLKPAQVAKRLRVPKKRVYELVQQGALPKQPGLGKTIRIPASALTNGHGRKG